MFCQGGHIHSRLPLAEIVDVPTIELDKPSPVTPAVTVALADVLTARN
jgi:hypothetical protein